MNSLFIKGLRAKFRFASPQGNLSIEDLWDLPLTNVTRQVRANLDDIAKDLYGAIQKETTTGSFVKPKTVTKLTVLQEMFDIVKYIIDVKLEEQKQAQDAMDRAQKRQKLLELLAKKQDAALESKSEAELLAELDALG